MRSWIHAAIGLLALFMRETVAGTPMTLEEAVAIAERRNPALIAARAQVAAARGELEDVRAPLFNNPEIVTESRRRALGQTGAPAFITAAHVRIARQLQGEA